MPHPNLRHAAVAALATLAVAAPAVAAPIGVGNAATPTLAWGPCDGLDPDTAALGYECAVARVPLDYAKPRGQQIEIGLSRLPATGERIGSLFWNPGGPGGGGRVIPPLSEELRARFDLVGFDPRGTWSSSGVRCYPTADDAASAFSITWPKTRAEDAVARREARAFSARCGERGGPVLGHMSTADVARDLELLRRAVGDSGLSFIGYSYGTVVGETYANMFPDRVRAVVIDGVIDPAEWTGGYRGPLQPGESRMQSSRGSRQALRSFLTACSASPACAFAEPGVDLERKFFALLDRLAARPVVIEDPDIGRIEVDDRVLIDATLGALYTEYAAAPLGTALAEIDGLSQQHATSARGLRPPVVDLVETRPLPFAREGGDDYVGPEWTLGVLCLDSREPTDDRRWWAAARRANVAGAPFGPAWMYLSLPCASWPVADPDRYAGPWDRRTAAPILVIGNGQGDPATPYDDAVTTAQLLGRGRLLTYDGWGHTAAYSGLSTCIDDATTRYLVDGVLPPKGTVCGRNRDPFAPLPEVPAG